MRSDGLYGNERGLFTRKRPNTSSSLWGACVVIILPRAWTDTRHLSNGASQPGERASGRVLCAGHGVGPARGAQGKRGLPSPGQLAGERGDAPRGSASDVTLWGTLSPPGTGARNTGPHRASCARVRRGRAARPKACGAAAPGGRPGRVTLGTFVAFSMLSSLCNLVCGY